MGYWNTRGLRGSSFEEMINMTNKVYREKNLAIIQKVPTPITPMKLDKSKGVITLAYFDQKSTIDYIGAAQGIPICLMQRKHIKVDCLCKMYISIRWNLWRIFKNKVEYHFFL